MIGGSAEYVNCFELVPQHQVIPLQIYDLKGSTRNRHVQSTGRENEVLLDENLVESEYLSKLQLNLLSGHSG
jgi:hypothetical protein